MEIHFVHVRSDLEVFEALQRKDGLAIVAVFCNVQAEQSDHERGAFEELIQYIPQLMSIGDRVSGMLMDLRKLMSPEKGSLTSPECNEVVVWIIFYKPIFKCCERVTLSPRTRQST
ncbi:jg18972 [Pararge aegeria aegeria]|uniref:carbonic anhydrase n=1 Tax=Pararge aegeria aegeria TaxID=348720 RepID=A0A8S4SPT1_9NEOP|nr:jg18972 [Pararge aegeria aegeria]